MSPRHPVHCVLPQKVRCHTQKVKCRGLLTVKRCTYTKGRTGGGKAYKAREIYCQKNTQRTSPVTRYNADPRRAHTLNAFSMEIRSDGCRHECLTQCRMSHSMPNGVLNARAGKYLRTLDTIIWFEVLWFPLENSRHSVSRSGIFVLLSICNTTPTTATRIRTRGRHMSLIKSIVSR